MATHDYVIDNSTGANVRADINNVLQAILTNNSSSSAPSTTAAYMWWADTTTGILKIRNSANDGWVELLQLDGTLTLEDGSVSAPALAFRDDLNTGIFSSAADTFNVATAGVERMELGATTIFNEDGADVDFRIEGDTEANLFYVDAGNNRIGIGVSAPNTKLHIRTELNAANNGTAILQIENTRPNTGTGAAALAFRTNEIVSGQSYIRAQIAAEYDGASNVSGRLVFLTVNSSGAFAEAMRIDDSQNVGIGTSSPDGKLSVTGDIVCNSGTVRSNDGFVSDSDLIFNADANDNGSNSIIFKESNLEKMRVDSNGEVLIGTTSTSGISSSANDLVVSKSGNMGITIRSTNSSYSNIFYADSDGGAQGYVSYQHSTDSLQIATNTTERLRITSNGQIMFGCTDVTDSGSSVANNFAFSSDGNPNVVRSHSNVIYGRSSNSADRHCMQLVQHRFNRTVFLSVHTNTGITGQHLLFYQGTNAVGGISTSDSATSYSTSSDYRLKENETLISDGITRLKTLIPRRFNWKIDETNTLVDGFFAHEVTAVPEAVTGTKDQVATADDVSNEIKEGDPIYQSIDQSKLVPLITAALQEAVAKIEVLETKVAALEAA